MNVHKTLWIGSEGAAFERVSLAFQILGYTPPQPNRLTSDSHADGAYVSNILQQYQGVCSKQKVLDVIAFGLAHERDRLRAWLHSTK